MKMSSKVALLTLSALSSSIVLILSWSFIEFLKAAYTNLNILDYRSVKFMPRADSGISKSHMHRLI